MVRLVCRTLLWLLCASSCGPSGSTPRWSMLERDGRSHRGAMARLGDRIIAFGGQRQGLSHDETWAWDGSRWELLHPAHRPPARSGHGLAKVGSHVVLFGGDSGLGRQLEDTWVFDGTDWVQRPTGAHPGGFSSFVFTSFGARAVLFGSTADRVETWEWDGARWTQRTPVNQPSPRLWPAMAEVQGRLVLFGGAVPLRAQPLGDTWSWDGTDWTLLSPTTSPSPRGAAAYATLDGRLLLYGGSDYQTLLDDLWSFDGSTWSQVAAVGPLRLHFASGASLGAQLVVAGGQTENLREQRRTFLWNGASWSSAGSELRPTSALGVLDGGLFAAGTPGVSPEPWTLAWGPDGWDTVVALPRLGWSTFTVGGRLVSPTLLSDGGTEDSSFDGRRWTQLRGERPSPLEEPFTFFTRQERLFLAGARGEWAWDDGTWRKTRGLSSAPSGGSVIRALSRATLEPLLDVYLVDDAGASVVGAWSLGDGGWQRVDFRFPDRATPFSVGDELFAWGACDGPDAGEPSVSRLCQWADAGWQEVEVEGVAPPSVLWSFVPAGRDVYFVAQGSGDLWKLSLPQSCSSVGAGTPACVLAVLVLQRRARRRSRTGSGSGGD